MSLSLKLQITKGDFKLHTALELPGKHLTAIYGPSGCGKTTLLRAIAGLERYEDNEITFHDRVWQDNQHWIPTHQRGVGMVFQKPALFTHLSVEKNLHYGWKRRPPGKNDLSIPAAADLLGIAHLLKRNAGSLSGGEGQRVAIARALLSHPALLLMDEPLSALDDYGKQQLLPYLERIHRSLHVPVLYVSHSLEEIARLADHVVLMEAGKVLQSAPAQQLLSNPEHALAYHRHAQSILEGHVMRYDPSSGTCTLSSEAGELLLASAPIGNGTKVRIRIQARDVSIALHPIQDSSVLNLLPATITGIHPGPDGQCLVALHCNEVPLLSRITRLSAERLNLRPGQQVIAQIKSAALLGDVGALAPNELPTPGKRRKR